MNDQAARPPAPWWAINGMGLMVAALEVVLGVAGIVDGPDSPIAWAYRIGIIAAGLGLLHGYITLRVRAEVYASVLLVAANLVDFVHDLLTTYPPDLDETALAVQVVIAAGVSIRIWALMRGGVYTVPQWRHR